MSPPSFTLEKIKFGTNAPTFEKAVALYEAGKVTQVKEMMNGYSATVIGTKPYHVFVESRRIDYGDCDCYLGQNGTLCKHMVALAISVVQAGQPLTENDKKVILTATCSGKLGTLSASQLVATKQSITSALRCIKPYNGPSRTWFAYQDSLSEGCNRLTALVSVLPVSKQTALILVDLLLRLEKKLMGGTDDSDGTVGGFMQELVNMLLEFVKLDPSCISTFKKLCGQQTSFGWEEPLVRIFDESANL